MSDRITRNVSGSGGGSSDSEDSGHADVGGGGSPLGAIGQDGGEHGKSGGDSHGRGSLQGGAGCSGPGYVALGAQPKKRSGKKEEKGGRATGTGKGVEWHKKDRRAAKVYKGKGQKMAADRDASLLLRQKLEVMA
ncbi:hypothetical protein [Candidatus Ichthyocystis sparus]|uniref:hypothetical protein n=1 Tax=Candidatus Ichthyocystis sparus TaxID=1561004 RepID=UPI000B8064CC|nr:hypothetical protein [Candidatus Ichthyocystis sparus]